MPWRTFTHNILKEDFLPMIRARLERGESLRAIAKTYGVTQQALGSLVPCCAPCNMVKGTMSTEKFLRHIQNIFEWSILGIQDAKAD